MELKNYQEKVLDELGRYLHFMNTTPDLFAAWQAYWASRDIGVGPSGVPRYNNAIRRTPHVCMKVPTGGGKTFMAACALRRIFDALPSMKEKMVVWLVPSTSILDQTLRSFQNPSHPYRGRLDRDFAGRVEVLSKEELLSGQNFSPDTVRENLTLCVLSYDSLRINSRKKDVRKVYQENGNLMRFVEAYHDKGALLPDTPDTALIQVLRQLHPVVVVDESHNAGSDLSTEMLNNLAPSFVLDLTATPRKNSNVISYVDARELKKEHMVKLPVIVYNRKRRQDVIADAVLLRGRLEACAEEEEEKGMPYIRPIVLFQAQPKVGEGSETFDKIKVALVKAGIPEEEIAIKTSKVDDLKQVDLLAKGCPIRYIITVNALKEGWDCPFAYILASLANKTSTVDVEQILGRILREPYARKQPRSMLNISYVLTSSSDFYHTLDSVVAGLNEAGFSGKDYRVGGEEMPLPAAKEEKKPTSLFNGDEAEETDTYSDMEGLTLTAETEGTSSVDGLLKLGEQQEADYERKAEEADREGYLGGELGEKVKQFKVKDEFADDVAGLAIPQFYRKSRGIDLFQQEKGTLLYPENLNKYFSLDTADADIDFSASPDDMYTVDLSDTGDAVPQYRRTARAENLALRETMLRQPTSEYKRYAFNTLRTQLGRDDGLTDPEISRYLKRVIGPMSEDEITDMEQHIATYAEKIRQKIESLRYGYRKKMFFQYLDTGYIVAQPGFTFPEVITCDRALSSVPKSLYEAERNDMNHFEREVLDDMVALPNVKWWHRNVDRREFCINGFLNHYPDFIVMTSKGRILMVETKGDHLVNEDSLDKLALGRKWADAAGPRYGYFMVFESRDIGRPGAYSKDAFIQLLREL